MSLTKKLLNLCTDNSDCALDCEKDVSQLLKKCQPCLDTKPHAMETSAILKEIEEDVTEEKSILADIQAELSADQDRYTKGKEYKRLIKEQERIQDEMDKLQVGDDLNTFMVDFKNKKQLAKKQESKLKKLNEKLTEENKKLQEIGPKLKEFCQSTKGPNLLVLHKKPVGMPKEQTCDLTVDYIEDLRETFKYKRCIKRKDKAICIEKMSGRAQNLLKSFEDPSERVGINQCVLDKDSTAGKACDQNSDCFSNMCENGRCFMRLARDADGSILSEKEKLGEGYFDFCLRPTGEKHKTPGSCDQCILGYKSDVKGRCVRGPRGKKKSGESCNAGSECMSGMCAGHCFKDYALTDGKIADFGVPFGKGYFELCAKVNDTTHEEPGHCNTCIDGYSMNEFNLCEKN